MSIDCLDFRSCNTMALVTKENSSALLHYHSRFQLFRKAISRTLSTIQKGTASSLEKYQFTGGPFCFFEGEHGNKGVTGWQCACQRMQWKNLCPVSQDVSITIPGSWLTGLRFLLAVVLCGSRKYPYPPHRRNWNFQGGGGWVKGPGKS